MTADREPRDRLHDLPPSHKWVLTILADAEHPMTTREIVAETAPFDIPNRTVRDAIQRCRKLGVVERHDPPTPKVKPRYGVAGELRQARED